MHKETFHGAHKFLPLKIIDLSNVKESANLLDNKLIWFSPMHSQLFVSIFDNLILVLPNEGD